MLLVEDTEENMSGEQPNPTLYFLGRTENFMDFLVHYFGLTTHNNAVLSMHVYFCMSFFWNSSNRLPK